MTARLGGGIYRRTISQAEGGANLTWATLRAQFCPWALPSGSRLSLRPCLAADVGELSAKGTHVDGVQRFTRVWFAPGLLLRAEWRVLDALAIELEGAGMVPTTYDTFALNPGVVLYHTPPVLIFAGAGVAVHFP